MKIGRLESIWRYPGYIEKFKALEAMCPIEDRSTLETLVQHEEALVAFAERERTGYAGALAPIRDFMVKYR